MKLETFFENFALLTDAPNAVAKLREIVLQLAVQGKLDCQDTNDEPISILLEEIEAKRKELVKTKGIKQIKILPIVNFFETPFEIPSHWRWIRLGAISQKLGAGSTPLGGKSVYVDSGIKFLRSQNVWNDGLRLDGVVHITPEIHQKMSGTVVEPGDVLLNITGASIGRSAVVPEDFDEGNVSQHVSIIRLIDKRIRHYIHLCMISSLIQTKIMEVQVGISREGLSMARLKDFPVPLPPLAEQKRIVEKCDRLLILCDEIEKRQQQRHQSLLKMNDSALSQLLAAQTPTDFQHHWQAICTNFDLLYSIPETIPKLRQAILQLAVQGKLVPQNLNDEPASAILAKISAKKTRLVGTAKVGRQKSSSSEEEIDKEFFEIPDSWEWSKLDGVTSLITDGEHATPPRTPERLIPLGTAKNVRDGFLDLTVTDYVPVEVAEKCWKRCQPSHNDILMVCVGATTGRLCLLKQPPAFVIVRSVALIRPFEEHIYPEYLALAIRTPCIQNQVWGNVKQSAQPCLYINRMQKLWVPIPPLAEQKRIVAKVDSLLSLCDALEAKLKATRDSSATLMEVVAKQVLVA